MDANEAHDVSHRRAKWAHPLDFVLSSLGYAVGLGNVWRFPYLCYENGGGAFLLPYIFMLVFIGVPMFLYELALGQYSGKGTYHVWDMAPIFRGVGIAMLWRGFINLIFYSQIVAWSVYYMFASFKKTLPWDGCKEDFSAYCYSKAEASNCEAGNGTWFNQTCFYSYNSTNDSFPSDLHSSRVFPSQEYFGKMVLQKTPGIDDTGGLIWQLCLSRLLACILVFFCIMKSIRSSGKIVYFTAIFPYVILTVLVIRGCLLEGALEGIKFYLVPKWKALLSPKVWLDAAGQIFFSLGAGTGALLTLSSYNRFNNNILRDTMVVTIGNCLTSVYAGFAIFSVLGFMAHEMEQEVDQVAKQGSGLAFVVYPEAVTHLPVSQLWSFLFFFMCILLGLDSLFGSLENLMTACLDIWPKLRKYKPLVAFALCSCIYLGGLSTCTRAGLYWTDLLNHYVAGWTAVILAMVQLVIVSWVYGAQHLKKHIETMLHFTLSPVWVYLWKFVSPLLLLVILLYNLVNLKPLHYEGKSLPDWARALGWLITLSSVVACPLGYIIMQLATSYKKDEYQGCSFVQRLRKLAQPNEKWGPQDDGSATTGNRTAVQFRSDQNDNHQPNGGTVQMRLLENSTPISDTFPTQANGHRTEPL